MAGLAVLTKIVCFTSFCLALKCHAILTKDKSLGQVGLLCSQKNIAFTSCACKNDWIYLLYI